MKKSQSKLSFNGTWSMAVGGMVGGGIFSTLGVVIGIAGRYAWLSFVVAGLIALAAGYSYVMLTDSYGEGGGAFHVSPQDQRRRVCGKSLVGAHRRLRTYQCRICLHLRALLGVRRRSGFLVSLHGCSCHHAFVYRTESSGRWRGWRNRNHFGMVQIGRTRGLSWVGISTVESPDALARRTGRWDWGITLRRSFRVHGVRGVSTADL